MRTLRNDIISLKQSILIQTKIISGLSCQIQGLESKIDALENEISVYRKFIDTRISSLPEDRPEKFKE